MIPTKSVFADQSSEMGLEHIESKFVSSYEEIESPHDEKTTVDDNSKESSENWQVVRMRVTAYCPCSKCCGDYSDGITACNHHIQKGDRFVAADKKYSFGTEMIIPGYNKSCTVEIKDRGGAIQGNRLDVYFDTHQEALEWGVQYLDVLIKIS
jgi:3D (Asp-Asp-Asp) domain-containing protein